MVSSQAAMPAQDAVVLENWVAYPDRLEMRKGATNHVTGFTQPVKALWQWGGPTTNKLLAFCDNGIFDASVAGPVGAAAAAITNGKVVATNISTGGGSFLVMVNGTDSMIRYDGSAYTSTANLTNTSGGGAVATTKFFAIETYKQRLYLLEKNSMSMWFLDANSVSGNVTEYPLGAIFRRGGYLQALATWTVDGGIGPDDNLVIATSNGEVAVFSGTNPSDVTAWALRGVYYVGKPIGPLSLLKYGGELLMLTESGLFPLSQALQSASVSRYAPISLKVQQQITDAVSTYGANYGWQLLAAPDIPLLLLNVPGTGTGTQFVMHAGSGGWSVFSGWNANCWARFGSDLYFGGSNFVAKAWTGFDDFDVNITATLIQAFNKLGQIRPKRVKMVRPIFTGTGPFSFSIGLINDFDLNGYTNQVLSASTSPGVWNTSTWNNAVWNGTLVSRGWRNVPDKPGVYKALYLQCVSNTSRAAFEGGDILFQPQATFA